MAEPVPESYYQQCNEHLLRAVPAGARRILDVGCGEGGLGARLRAARPERRVYGLERVAEVAERARRRLDDVFVLDVEQDDVPLEDGSLDCIVYGDVLEHLVEPEGVLRRHRRLLAEGGRIVCSVPNIQHHSIVTALLRSDFQYTWAGLLDSTHLRFFTYSTFAKLLLDAGYSPTIDEVIEDRCTFGFLQAARPLLRLVGAEPLRTARYLDAYQYIFSGVPLPDLPLVQEPEPLTFVVLVSDDSALEANLLRSPCLAAGTRHEILPMRGCQSAAEGMNRGLSNAKNRLVVLVHQDVYLPRGWDQRFVAQLAQAEERFGPLGVAGVYGVAGKEHLGHVLDRDVVLRRGSELPAQVDTLDELLLAVPRDSPVRFDPALGFHFYGADACLSAKGHGLSNVTVDAICFHNSLTTELNEAFHRAGRVFAHKWRDSLPVTTSCAEVSSEWLRRIRLQPPRWPMTLSGAIRRQLHRWVADRHGRAP